MATFAVPWDEASCTFSKDEKETAYRNLRRLRYPLDMMRNPPEERVQKVLSLLMPEILSEKWLLVVSNSSVLLQAIAEFCPVCFTLTTGDSCLTVSNDFLVQEFLSRRGIESIFDGNPLDDMLRQVKSAGFVAWQNATTPHQSGTRYHEIFANWLMKRRRLGGRPTMFLASYAPREQETTPSTADIRLLMGKLSDTLGETVANLIKEICELKYFHARRENLPAAGFEV